MTSRDAEDNIALKLPESRSVCERVQLKKRLHTAAEVQVRCLECSGTRQTLQWAEDLIVGIRPTETVQPGGFQDDARVL
eukprot:g12.t1